MAGLRAYRVLSRVFPRSLRARLTVLVLVCTLLPLSGLVVWLLRNNGAAAEPEELLAGLLLAVGLTIVGILISLMLIYHLLAPLRLMVDAVEAYQAGNHLPDLPEDGKDELGVLMRAINSGLRDIDQGVRELERFAMEDPLTRAFNRRGIERQLLECVEEAERHDMPLTLYVVDLDNLKQVNDEYGHAAGDRMLIELVESARMWLSDRDHIGRLGGDEFLLCVHEPVDGASPKVDIWLSELAALRVNGISVRVSAGCAEFRPGLDALSLYREADAAMYKAKASGGSRLVCDADHLVLPPRDDVSAVHRAHTGNNHPA
ncbi:MAG: GGDEF domain-containing protein [Lysobacter sp.]